ncbi:MAG: DUF2298 domain-containing protein [Anaerolineae bacterium]|nr:DUF2298 domain-containing protein [Anaerolineae bacterium]
MVISILVWYLVLQFMALMGLPLAFSLFKRLPSRGYGTAKALGLLLTGVIFWWGGILGLWGNTSSAVLAAAAIVWVAGLVLMRRHWHELRPWWQSNRRYVIVVEVLFLISLVAWAFVRASQPQLQTAGGEKWMEIAFLNAMLRAPTLPPQDPWLSGFTLSYYYLGYLLLGVLTRLSMLAPTVAFNLGNAGWFALVAAQAYSIVYDLTRGKAVFRSLVAPLMLLLAGNGEGLFEVLHARGHLSVGFWKWLDINRLDQPPQPPFSPIPRRFFGWWQASRTIRDRTPWGDVQEVIDEFPAFSFILGDMHPHLMALPFVLIAIAIALNAYRQAVATKNGATEEISTGEATGGDADRREAPQRPVAQWLTSTWRSLRHRIWPIAGYAVILGALGFLNTWDFPIYWALLVGAQVLGRYAPADKSMASFLATVWTVIPEAGVMGVLSIVLYLPFWFALRSQAGGILPNLFNATKPQQFVVMFLPLLIPAIGVIVGSARRRSIKPLPTIGLGMAFVVAIALVALIVGSAAAYPYIIAIIRGESVQGYSLAPETVLTALKLRLKNSWIGLVLAIGVAATFSAIVQPIPTRGEKVGDASQEPQTAIDDGFPLLLALMGLLLTLAPEFVYLQDVFMTRMNTIFKFYFQAWVLWSLAGAWQLTVWLRPIKGAMKQTVGRSVAAAVALLLIAAGLVYTVLAVPARAREQGVPWTLDGAAWLQQSYPEDAAAIAWLNDNIKGTPVIVEAPGDQHRAYVYEGRVSALTGLPAVLGWGGHQLQWRGNYDEPGAREADLNILMTTLNHTEATRILERYNVGYVYVGPLERQRYPEEALAKFAEMFSTVYDQNGVTIYEVP